MTNIGHPSATEQQGVLSRGVVLIPEDLAWEAWPRRAKEAGLNVLALHPTPAIVSEFVRGDRGRAFVATCKTLGLDVEYELHAMSDLLPRELFARYPDLFRMDEQGQRQGDWNLCVHSTAALDLVAENALRLAEILRPTTGRYHLWGDDGRPWCRCPRCRELSDSEQALVLENHLLKALQTADAGCQVAHLAYQNTLEPPRQVRPSPGVFCEFAPIARRYDVPLGQREARHRAGDPTHGAQLDALEANLAWFGRENAGVLEYWLDVSRYSGWKRPAVQIPWHPEVLAADLETYGARGIRYVTSFAVWIDAAYVARYGEPPLGDYGAHLATATAGRRQ
jgi:hypothetical protein